MNASHHLRFAEDFDEPWRRLPWVILAALLSWILLLGGFAKLLERKPAPEAPPTTIEARIIEMPPPAGLQGGGSAGGTPAVAHPAPIVRPVPKPVHVAKLKPIHHVHKVKAASVITEPLSPFGTAKHVEHPEPAAPAIASKGPSGGVSKSRGRTAGAEGGGEGGIGGGTGSGSGVGIGSDSAGARAMFAPTPTIPDDLREGAFSTMAVAHFRVSPEGNVEVTLIKPTPNPRLNQILLDTLKQWKFFPAMKNGIAIASEFEVRIPIAVQ